MRLIVSNEIKTITPDERAYLVQLAALNAALEAARAGQPMAASKAMALEQIIERYFASVTQQH